MYVTSHNRDYELCNVTVTEENNETSMPILF